MKPTVLTPDAAMRAAIASAISEIGCARRYVQSPLPGFSSTGASDNCGVCDSVATSAIAIDGATADEPTMMSTWSSVTSLRAMRVPVVGSDASSTTTRRSFSPPMLSG